MMGYTVPDKGTDATYIVKNETDYPEKFEPMLSEFAQLLTDINGGIALVNNISTGQEYFSYLSEKASSNTGTSITTEYFSGDTLTIDDTNGNYYNNKLIVLTSDSAYLQVYFAVDTRSALDSNFYFEVAFSGTTPNGINFYGETDANNIVISKAGDSPYLITQFAIAQVWLLPDFGNGIEFLVSSPDGRIIGAF